MAATRQLTMRIDESTKAFLERLSENMGISQTAVIESAVRDYEWSIEWRMRFAGALEELIVSMGQRPHAEVESLSSALQIIAGNLVAVAPGNHDTHRNAKTQKRIVTADSRASNTHEDVSKCNNIGVGDGAEK